MAKASTGGFTNSFIQNVVAISVGVVVFAMVALPIIGQVDVGENTNLQAIIDVLPIFIAIGLLLACVYMFIVRKN